MNFSYDSLIRESIFSYHISLPIPFFLSLPPSSFTRPRRGYTIASTGEDGVHRKKRGGALELRRTRLFSPVVNVPVPDVFTSAGQPTTLVCEASGTPAPEVVWTQNNEPLDKERFIQLADSSLFINDTDLKDEGAYIVTATNSAGTAEQMVRVTVIRPSPPERKSESALSPPSPEISLEFSEDVGVGAIWEELLTTLKLCFTYLKVKGVCLLKALKFKHLKYAGENTDHHHHHLHCIH